MLFVLYMHDFDAVIIEAIFFVGHVFDAAVWHFAVSLTNEEEFFNRETDQWKKIFPQ